MRICRMAATPFSVNKFLRSQIEASLAEGYKVLVVTGQDQELSDFCSQNGVEYEIVDIERRFTPVKDLLSLLVLIKRLRKYKIDCMHTISSKGGLLGVLVAKLLGVPCIMHIYAGLPWCEMSGLKRNLGKLSDILIGKLSTITYTDSFSQRDFIINQGVCSPDKVKVLGEGSVSGFDLDRFDRVSLESQALIEKKKIGLSDSQRIILFVGRVTKEKGVGELISAFSKISAETQDVSLLLVGPYEDNIDPLDVETKIEIRKNSNIHHLGYKTNPEIYYAMSEFLVLPSYREGFGNVVIEAAITGIPTIGTDIFGLTDSIQNNESGLLVQSKDEESLYESMKLLLNDEDLRKKLGNCAKHRAINMFSKDHINELLLNEYKKYIK